MANAQFYCLAILEHYGLNAFFSVMEPFALCRCPVMYRQLYPLAVGQIM